MVSRRTLGVVGLPRVRDHVSTSPGLRRQQLGPGGVQSLRLAGGDDHVGAGRPEGMGDSEPDPAGAAGDHGHPLVQSIHG